MHEPVTPRWHRAFPHHLFDGLEVLSGRSVSLEWKAGRHVQVLPSLSNISINPLFDAGEFVVPGVTCLGGMTIEAGFLKDRADISFVEMIDRVKSFMAYGTHGFVMMRLMGVGERRHRQAQAEKKQKTPRHDHPVDLAIPGR